MFGKIAKDVIAKDVSEPFFLLRVLSAFSSAYSIIEERNTEKVREMMSLEDDKHRKCDFTKMGQGYFFYDFLSALYKGYKDSGVVKPRRKSAGDENSELIDAMLRNLRLYVTDRANASQGRNDDGTFANNEAMVVYPELRGIPEENRKYVYSFPVAYPVKNLLDSLPMFQQEFRKKSLGIKIEYPSDCSAIYFTVFPVIDLFEKGLVFNWHEAMEKSVTLKRSPLEIPVGVDETGNIVLLPSIADNPHAMLAGGTGTGKSVAE